MTGVGHQCEQVPGVEVEKPRVVAHEAASERSPGKVREVFVLQRLDLTRRELQLLRRLVERQPRRLARSLQTRARADDRRHRGSVAVRFERGHSHFSVAIAWVSGAFG
jgi:hypothetical protein